MKMRNWFFTFAYVLGFVVFNTAFAGGILTTGGSSSSPSTGTEWTQIGTTQVANNSTTITFTNVTGYVRYKVVYTNIVFSNIAVPICEIVVSSNNGSSYVTAGYSYNVMFSNSATAPSHTDSVSAASVEYICGSGSGAVTSAISGDFYLYQFNTTNVKIFHSVPFAYTSTTTNPQNNVVDGTLASATAMNAFQLFLTAGNFTSGSFTLLGSSF